MGEEDHATGARAHGAERTRVCTAAWGGSVADSVLGAMLTQNVSDVLSSSAIMNLAASASRASLDGARRDAAAPPEAL